MCVSTRETARRTVAALNTVRVGSWLFVPTRARTRLEVDVVVGRLRLPEAHQSEKVVVHCVSGGDSVQRDHARRRYFLALDVALSPPLLR
jgi:hypothetical protein